MVSLFSKLRGITETVFQIGVGRAQLKSLSTGELEVRDSADSAYAVLRVATPVGNADAVTKLYADSIVGGGGGSSSVTKAGFILASSFSGTPQKATVTFGTSFVDASYAVVITCVTSNNKNFSPSVETQAAGSFDIQLGTADKTDLVQVNWLAIKLTNAGNVTAGSFSGTPKKATVTFATSFIDANYSVVLGCLTTNGKNFSPSVESQSAASFVIQLGSNDTTDLTQVSWVAIKNGESL